MPERDAPDRPDAAAKLARALGVTPRPAERGGVPDGAEATTEDPTRESAGQADSQR